MEPTPFPPQKKSGGDYFVGLGLGSIPLVLFLFGVGSFMTYSPSTSAIAIYLIFAAFFLYVILFIATIIFLSNVRSRATGYGLLTALLATPVVAYIGCIAMIYRPH